jgi:tRNA uridine 5-carbamoylmethylation protein Kti12
MNKFYVLVGVPGSGKSTWVKSQAFDPATTVYVSTDYFVDQYADLVGKTYSEVFKEYMPTAIDQMMETVYHAVENRFDIVWDQTSTSVKTRRRKLKYAPADYEKIAVVFLTPDPDTHAKWLDRPGKNIPAEIVQDMISRFEMPTLAEGFDKVIEVQR